MPTMSMLETDPDEQWRLMEGYGWSGGPRDGFSKVYIIETIQLHYVNIVGDGQSVDVTVNKSFIEDTHDLASSVQIGRTEIDGISRGRVLMDALKALEVEKSQNDVSGLTAAIKAVPGLDQYRGSYRPRNWREGAAAKAAAVTAG